MPGDPQPSGTVADRRLAFAGALAHPTRLRLYEILEGAVNGSSSPDHHPLLLVGGPGGASAATGENCSGPGECFDVATLTSMVGVHHTTVRAHLARLRDAGLLEERNAAPAGRGRPKLLYCWIDPAR